MEVEKTLRPGADGTKRFVERYGQRLVCVRHRHDRAAGMRYTTVELIVDQRLTSLRLDPTAPYQSPRRLAVRIAYKEQDLRQKIREAGGQWDTKRRVWWLDPDVVHRLGLKDRLA